MRPADTAELLAKLEALAAANPSDGWTWTMEEPKVEIVYRETPPIGPRALHNFPVARWGRR